MQATSSRRRGSTTKRPITVMFATSALAGLRGSCSNDGGAASSTSTHELSAEENAEFASASQFARCMRDHGIDGLPDPQVSSNGFMFVGVPLAGPSEDWNTAQDACRSTSDDAATPAQGGVAAAAWERIVSGPVPTPRSADHW